MSSGSVFVDACYGRPTARVPVWFMRQAGRSLPEYRELKGDRTVLEVCAKPELAAELTLQPVRRLGVDAAILFSDIVFPLFAAGVGLDIAPGIGPVIAEPVRSARSVAALPRLHEEHLDPVIEAVRLVTAELDRPLIGFAGGPFTLACYLVEGGPSKDHARTKALMHSEPGVWRDLMQRLTEDIVTSLRAQISAGAAAVQLFDSWVGALSPDDFARSAGAYVARIFAALEPLGVPRIYFGVATGELLAALAKVGAEVVGVDWRVPLDAARTRLGPEVAVQGNLDPAACLAPWEVVEPKALDVLERGGGRGHVFNLGHGVHPDTDPSLLAHVVELVHGWEPRG